MKRRNREINIFSMSALDLFASALGAFILIAIVLFPFFPNIGSSPEDIAALRAELAETRRQMQSCRSDLAQTRAELQAAQESLQDAQSELQAVQESLQDAQSELQAVQESLQDTQSELRQCTDELKKKFLLIVISWGSTDDVDLHVIDPQGNEFYYDRRSFPNTEAKLEEDNTHGPGNEIWLHPRATPGQYRVYYKLYDRRSAGASIRGVMLTPGGRESIPNHEMRRHREKRLVAVITVDNNGDATLQTQ